MIAIMPLTPEAGRHWWEHNYPKVSIGLGALVAAYYLIVLGDTHTPAHTAIEYASFIALIGSLFVVSGGIHIRIRGEARPIANVVFLFVGAVLANFIGTTGASMVLIRPWIRMNKYRVTSYHVVFFIFIVSNVGGALTPIGDPPLFLGYLHGIPFFWITQHALLPWFFTLGCLLTVFFLLDRRNFLRAPAAVREKETATGPLVQVEGMHNVLFLGAIVAAVFLPATYFIREIVMLGAAFAAYRFTPGAIRERNAFTFGPVKEVAFLFVGIFLTMMPALGYLKEHGREFALNKPLHYYFASGSLSAVLDNAPTYLTFLQLGETVVVPESVADEIAKISRRDPVQHEKLLLDWMRDETHVSEAGSPTADFIVAVSLGAVFFGAMTYIGNGPNFMVRSIAEAEGVRMPDFFGYVFRFAFPFLLPVLIAVGFIFL